MKNIIYFIFTSLIWGSTLLVITFQFGVVEPIVSLVYRYLLAYYILLILCYATGRKLKYSIKEHYFMLQHGVILFGIHYWISYSAELYIASGLVAVAFSTIVFFNIFNSPIIGFMGLLLVFNNEIINFLIAIILKDSHLEWLGHLFLHSGI